MRENPLKWDDEAPQGVLSPFEGEDLATGEDSLHLLGQPAQSLLKRDIPSDALTNGVVRKKLDEIALALRAAAREGRAWRARVDNMADDARAALFDALGSGEVSMAISGVAADEGVVQINETILPGVWVGRAEDNNGVVRAEWVEVADAPKALREAAAMRPREKLALDALTPPRDTMNVMGVLNEISARSAAWCPGDENHVMNFTLFPMTEADTAFLASVVGEVGVRVTSGGYGTARVIMTALKNVWAVQFLNGLGAIILDTIEIGDIPKAVLASQEDFEDSAARLDEIQEAYRE